MGSSANDPVVLPLLAAGFVEYYGGVISRQNIRGPVTVDKVTDGVVTLTFEQEVSDGPECLIAVQRVGSGNIGFIGVQHLSLKVKLLTFIQVDGFIQQDSSFQFWVYTVPPRQ
jgi:hypothetical protein